MLAVGYTEEKAAARKLYQAASLGRTLYVTRIRNEGTNDRLNGRAHAASLPLLFHSSLLLSRRLFLSASRSFVICVKRST